MPTGKINRLSFVFLCSVIAFIPDKFNNITAKKHRKNIFTPAFQQLLSILSVKIYFRLIKKGLYYCMFYKYETENIK